MKGLNVREIDETTKSLLMGSRRVNLNYYPSRPDPDLTVGVGRHSDISTLTVLLQNQTGGRYVRAPDGHGWIHMLTISGALVINIGDALQIMSNGRYKSIEHRVASNGSKNRISVPIFTNPKPSDIIGPCLKCLLVGRRPFIKMCCAQIMPSISTGKLTMGR
ncbi:2-oxoglutarate (2OG) and Fe(II)-dependent oxygenase superfamily protein [Trifolium repens]|nr:2-oxoglutarate (2OG) and Fe(II)-dependent oxygenase superfamily protein [Trifolium repens]